MKAELNLFRYLLWQLKAMLDWDAKPKDKEPDKDIKIHGWWL